MQDKDIFVIFIKQKKKSENGEKWGKGRKPSSKRKRNF